MKGSIILFAESKELIDDLNECQKAILLDALMAYAAGEEFPLSRMDLSARLVFKSMRQKIDAMNEKYDEKVAKRSDAGRAGAAARWGKDAIQDDAKNGKRINRIKDDGKNSLTEPDPEPKTEIKRKAPTEPKEKSLKDSFEEVWEAYPRKQGRKAAEASYLRARKGGTSHEDILAGIEAYKAYLEREKVEDKYVKQGNTFFNQAAWNDDWAPKTRAPAGRQSTGYEDALKGVDYTKLLWKEAQG